MKSRPLIARFARMERKKVRLTQRQLAQKAGVGLRFIRDLEQGKATLRMDVVDKVLKMFGMGLGPVPLEKR